MDRIRKLCLCSEEPLSLAPLPQRFLDEEWVPIGENDNIMRTPQNGAPFPFAASPVLYSEVMSARNLIQGEDVKTVLEIEINVKEHRVTFLPGDTVGVIPENSSDEVTEILKCIGISDKAKDHMKIAVQKGTSKKKAAVPAHIPACSTPEFILKNCIEIRAVPKKAFIRALSECTSDGVEKRRLHELSSRECSDEYQKFFLEEGYCLLDLLNAFPSCRPTLPMLLEHLPRLQSRPYSIASSPLNNAGSIHIVLSVLTGSRGRKGVCSGWLEDLVSPFTSLSSRLEKLTLGDTSKRIKIPIYFRNVSKFRIPDSSSEPTIMIGPGTGVAPFIGFLHHRRAQKKFDNQSFGVSKLFFGCRYKDKDFIFKDEILSFVEDGTLSDLFTCFSRENGKGSPKYVQDFLFQKKKDIVSDILEKGAYVFLCGEGSKMIKDIEGALVSCIQDMKGISKKEAEDILNILETSGKFVKDNWN